MNDGRNTVLINRSLQQILLLATTLLDIVALSWSQQSK